MRAPHILAAPLAAALVLSACSEPSGTPSAAAGTPAMSMEAMSHPATTGGFTVQTLSRSSFPDDIDAQFRIKQGGATNVVNVDGPSDMLAIKLTVQPGGSIGWHTHHGPALVTVAAGTLSIINARDCITRPYAAGQGLVDPGQGNVHIGFNAGTTETVAYVTYLDVPAGQGPTIPAADPGC